MRYIVFDKNDVSKNRGKIGILEKLGMFVAHFCQKTYSQDFYKNFDCHYRFCHLYKFLKLQITQLTLTIWLDDASCLACRVII